MRLSKQGISHEVTVESYSSLCLRQGARETTCPRLGMCVQLRLECSFVHEHPLLQMLVPTVSGIKALSFPNHDSGTSKGQVTIILKSPGLRLIITRLHYSLDLFPCGLFIGRYALKRRWGSP